MTAFYGFKTGQAVSGYRRRPQRSLVNITSGMVSGLAGVAEIQEIPYVGTRTNVVTNNGQNEIYQIQLDSSFNSGPAVGQYPSTGGVALTNFGTFTVSSTSNFSDIFWPSGTPTLSGQTGFTYIAPTSSDMMANAANTGQIVNNTGSSINLSGTRIRFRLTVTSNTSGSTGTGTFSFMSAPGPTTTYNTANGYSSSFISISTMVGATASPSTTHRRSDSTWAPGESIQLAFGIRNKPASGDYTIRVDAVELSFDNSGGSFLVSTGPASYSLDLNTGSGAPFETAITGTFSANADAATALGELEAAVEGDYPATSQTRQTAIVGDTDVLVTYNGAATPVSRFVNGVDFVGVNLAGGLEFLGFPLPLSSSETLGQYITRVNGTTVGGVTLTRVSSTQFRVTSTTRKLRNVGTNAYGAAGSSSASDESRDTSVAFTRDSNTGGWNAALPYAGTIGVSITNIDTDQQQNLAGSLTLTANGGMNVTGTLNSGFSDGVAPTVTTGMASTITVNDYSNGEITSFTASVPSASDTNIATVNTQIVNAYNTNTENPIDIRAEDITASDVIRITGQSPGPLGGLVSVDINNHDVPQAMRGTIDYQDATVTRAGEAPGTITISLTGGGQQTDFLLEVTTATTAAQIATALTAHVATDPGVTIADETEGRVMTSTGFIEYPDVSFTVTGASTNTLVTDIRTLQRGDSL